MVLRGFILHLSYERNSSSLRLSKNSQVLYGHK
nr:MAG TPA: hypothetical protein [Bacteriophage sp.]